MDESIFDWALSHTRRSNASEKEEENSVVALRSLLNVIACGRISSPRLYRVRLKAVFKVLNQILWFSLVFEMAKIDWVFFLKKIKLLLIYFFTFQSLCRLRVFYYKFLVFFEPWLQLSERAKQPRRSQMKILKFDVHSNSFFLKDNPKRYLWSHTCSYKKKLLETGNIKGSLISEAT